MRDDKLAWSYVFLGLGVGGTRLVDAGVGQVRVHIGQIVHAELVSRKPNQPLLQNNTTM